MSGLQNASQAGGSQNETHKSKKPKHTYTDHDDIQLCKSFGHVSNNAAIGVSQNENQFWDRIHADFMKNIGYPVEIDQKSLKNRWQLIKPAVLKFIACYTQVQREKQSGKTDADMVNDAKELYLRQHDGKKSFKYMHCWNELKEQPRFMMMEDIQPPQHPNVVDLGDDVDSPISSQPTRPIGRNAARERARKGKATSSSTESSPFIELQKTKLDMHNQTLEERRLSRELRDAHHKELLEEDRQERQRLYLQRQSEEDNKVMWTDLDTIRDPVRLEYFRLKQQDALARLRANQTRPPPPPSPFNYSD